MRVNSVLAYPVRSRRCHVTIRVQSSTQVLAKIDCRVKLDAFTRHRVYKSIEDSIRSNDKLNSSEQDGKIVGKAFDKKCGRNLFYSPN